MTHRIEQLIAQIKQLEQELSDELTQQHQELLYQLEGKKVHFEQRIRQAHKQLKVGIIPWLFGPRPINIITAPIIYSMIVPLVLSDICVSFYHYTCFPIYNIARVRRSDYIIIDRHQLSFLNIFEKFHCMYCGYANGLIAYIAEIIARTEQYFCPIKHARQAAHFHDRYPHFIPFGEAENYHQKLEALRQLLAQAHSDDAPK